MGAHGRQRSHRHRSRSRSLFLHNHRCEQLHINGNGQRSQCRSTDRHDQRHHQHFLLRRIERFGDGNSSRRRRRLHLFMVSFRRHECNGIRIAAGNVCRNGDRCKRLHRYSNSSSDATHRVNGNRHFCCCALQWRKHRLCFGQRKRRHRALHVFVVDITCTNRDERNEPCRRKLFGNGYRREWLHLAGHDNRYATGSAIRHVDGVACRLFQQLRRTTHHDSRRRNATVQLPMVNGLHATGLQQHLRRNVFRDSN